MDGMYYYILWEPLGPPERGPWHITAWIVGIEDDDNYAKLYHQQEEASPHSSVAIKTDRLTPLAESWFGKPDFNPELPNLLKWVKEHLAASDQALTQLSIDIDRTTRRI